MAFFFSQTHKRAAYHYNKKKKTTMANYPSEFRDKQSGSNNKWVA
jgi:hypothetical protein